jgi:hypothetical protein
LDKASGFAKKATEYDPTNKNAQAILTGIEGLLKS